MAHFGAGFAPKGIRGDRSLLLFPNGFDHSIMRWRNGLLDLSSIANTSVSHGIGNPTILRQVQAVRCSSALRESRSRSPLLTARAV